MGDIRSLVDLAKENVNQEQALEAREKLLMNKWTLDDFLTQMQQVKKMGSLTKVLGMIPGLGGMLPPDMDDKDLGIQRVEGIIHAMTPQERENDEMINHSRKVRIAEGAAASVKEVNDLIRDFREMRKQIKGMKNAGFFGKLQANRMENTKKKEVKKKMSKEKERAERLRKEKEAKRQQKKLGGGLGGLLGGMGGMMPPPPQG
jgi:signal recognition particle subunit SRP54